jgi:hypothetical protein
MYRNLRCLITGTGKRTATHLDVGIFEELLETVLVHLNGGDVLALLHIDVRNVQPHVAEISRSLAYLQHINSYCKENCSVVDSVADPDP